MGVVLFSAAGVRLGVKSVERWVHVFTLSLEISFGIFLYQMLSLESSVKR